MDKLLLNDSVMLGKLASEALELLFEITTPLKGLYRDLSQLLDTINAVLKAPNLCERCQLRLKETWHCDAASCEIMHRAECINFVSLG